jgi:hypothetical protein
LPLNAIAVMTERASHPSISTATNAPLPLTFDIWDSPTTERELGQDGG